MWPTDHAIFDAVGTRAKVALRPKTPQNADGSRIDPPPSAPARVSVWNRHVVACERASACGLSRHARTDGDGSQAGSDGGGRARRGTARVVLRRVRVASRAWRSQRRGLPPANKAWKAAASVSTVVDVVARGADAELVHVCAAHNQGACAVSGEKSFSRA
jgi:hypothetical protein